MEEATKTLNEILDFFLNTGKDPGGDWAFPDDGSSLCLDYGGRHSPKFWIDIERDGRIRLYWRPQEGPAVSMTFVASQHSIHEQSVPNHSLEEGDQPVLDGDDKH